MYIVVIILVILVLFVIVGVWKTFFSIFLGVAVGTVIGILLKKYNKKNIFEKDVRKDDISNEDLGYCNRSFNKWGK